ncbi:MAG TPA: tetratricopeptide repeat protein [Methylomirabilota bacterium]|nr:tetratricopeptide repeat protein [Methylomirabilota bacterium]
MSVLRRWSTVVAASLLLLGPAGLTAARADGTPPPGGERAGADPDYAAGVKAIKAEQFAAAIPLLERAVARDALSADAHNWLAYAVRRNGDPARSIPIYQKALALDPKHRGAHEYIGEAYLTLGNLTKAREHLARLDSLCFLPCSEYTDLKKAVEQYEKRRKSSTTR